jgi:hypothetical protein
MVMGLGSRIFILNHLYAATLLSVLKVYTTQNTITPLRRSEGLKLLWKKITVLKNTGLLGS